MMAPRITQFIPLFVFALLAVVSAVSLILTLSGERRISELPSALVGRAVPETVLPSLDPASVPVQLAAIAGRPYLVNFFASWCAPCRAEAPALAVLAREIEIIGIAYKDRPEDTQKFLKNFGNPYAGVGMDRDGQAGLIWGVYGVPETYLIGADGRVVLRHAGPIDADIMKDRFLPEIKKILGTGARPGTGDKG